MAATKVYQNVSIGQLLDWSKRNPNRGHSLEPIRIQQTVEAKKDLGTSMAPLHLPNYQSMIEVYLMMVFHHHHHPNTRTYMVYLTYFING